MKPTVFIHTNAQQYVGAKVAEYAIKKMSPNRDKFEVKILHLKDYPCLYEREGQPHLRGGKKPIWHNWDLQSFTPLRFLPPQLMNYQGRAIVIDPDIFALTDIYELLTRDMEGKAIFCRKICPEDNNIAPFYGTSVMLLDCSKLTHWQWEKQIEEMFNFERDYQPWTRLLMEPEDSIGLLEEEWNHLDTLNDRTKLLHNTRRETQPWKTGLPIDFNRPNRKSGVPKKWGLIPVPWIRRTKAFIQGKEYYPSHIYFKHPDSNQEKLFFSLLGECLAEGIFTEELLISEMENNHLFPLSFLEGKIVIGLNMAWKVAPVQYSITTHPDLNIPEFMPSEEAHPEITWISGYFKTEAGVALKGVTSPELIEYAKNNFYFFDYLQPGKINTQPPNLPCDRGRVIDWVKTPTENYLYFWGSVSNAGVCLAANMGAKNIILIGCDNCSLLANHHAHNQHVRWKGVDPNQRYRQYYEGLSEVRTALRERGVNLLSLTPFMTLTNPEEDFEHLCQELNQPKLIENNLDLSEKISWRSYSKYYLSQLQKTVKERAKKLVRL